jgi:hypothetical protein
MDLALTFHIGLILRVPRAEEQREDDLRIASAFAVMVCLMMR